MSQATDGNSEGDIKQELRDLGEEIGETVRQAPDGSRRAFLGGLASIIGIQALSDIVAAQDAQPGAACTWLGDQNATGYGLYQLGILEFEDGTTLETAGDTTNTHINVEDDGTQILADVDAVNFGTDLAVTDDGDNSVTVDASSGSTTDTRTNVSDDGSEVVTDTADLDFLGIVTASADGDGSASIEIVGPISGYQIGESGTRNAGYFSTMDADAVANQDYNESVVTQSGSTGSLDLSAANVFEQTVTGDISFSFDNPTSSPAGNSFLLILIQDSTGGHAITWPSSVQWPGGSAPGLSTNANDKHILSFESPDGGSTWYGFVAGENVA